MGAEGGRVGLEIVGAFGGDEEVGGGKSVLDGVEAGAGLAFGGARSGAELGVGEIGFVLFCGGHMWCVALDPLIRGITRGEEWGGEGERVSG
jgi:hypothetical protein